MSHRQPCCQDPVQGRHRALHQRYGRTHSLSGSPSLTDSEVNRNVSVAISQATQNRKQNVQSNMAQKLENQKIRRSKLKENPEIIYLCFLKV